MEPYQEASEKIKEKFEQPGRFIKKAGSLGLGLAAGTAVSPIVARMIPFLNDLIPADLAIKGLTKINPKFGEFIDKSLKNGFSFDEIKDFLGQQAEKVEKNQSKSVFDELLGDVDINQLPEPVQNQLGFLKTISDQLEKKGTHRESSTFKRLKKKIDEVLSGKIGELQGEAMAMPQQTAQQQPGQGQQALMAILQKIQASRGG